MEDAPYFDANEAPGYKPVVWLFDTLEVLRDFPEDVKDEMGHALSEAQAGRKAPRTKPLSGDKLFRGGTVLEVVEDFDGDTYRAMYTAKFGGSVYVLVTFVKKSTTGIATPKHIIDLVKQRLRHVMEMHAPRGARQRKARN